MQVPTRIVGAGSHHRFWRCPVVCVFGNFRWRVFLATSGGVFFCQRLLDCDFTFFSVLCFVFLAASRGMCVWQCPAVCGFAFLASRGLCFWQRPVACVFGNVQLFKLKERHAKYKKLKTKKSKKSPSKLFADLPTLLLQRLTAYYAILLRLTASYALFRRLH